jgi:hypothetical protein
LRCFFRLFFSAFVFPRAAPDGSPFRADAFFLPPGGASSGLRFELAAEKSFPKLTSIIGASPKLWFVRVKL